MKGKFLSASKDGEKGAEGEGNKNAEDGQEKDKTNLTRNLIIVSVVILFIVAVALVLAFVDFTDDYTPTLLASPT